MGQFSVEKLALPGQLSMEINSLMETGVAAVRRAGANRHERESMQIAAASRSQTRRMNSAGRFIRLLAEGMSAALIGTGASALESEWPSPVKAALDERRAYCAEEKKPFRLGPQAIRKLDLSGEGHDDYILDDSAVTCGDEQAWCGSGGCGVSIFMQTANGYAKVFDDLGRKLKITRRDKGYMLVVPQRSGSGVRLVFDNGCAVDLANGKSRSCNVKE